MPREEEGVTQGRGSSQRRVWGPASHHSGAGTQAHRRLWETQVHGAQLGMRERQYFYTSS